MEPIILAGDVGGTKTNIGWFALRAGRLETVREERYSTQEASGLGEIIDDFQQDGPQPAAACFGVCGPVDGEGVAHMTNVPWKASQAEVEERTGVRAELVNDLVAMAYGVLALDEDSFEVLNPGRADVRGNRAVIAAGTGLGEAILFRDSGGWIPIPSEGGHADYSPTSEIEIELLKHLMRIYGRISSERVLSGPGIVNIFNFLRDKKSHVPPHWLTAELERRDPAAVVTEAALAGKSQMCELALDLFVRAYGAEAGDLALIALATGGVYLGGGIAPRILKLLKGEAFLGSFFNKGRLSRMMSEIPVKVLMEPRAPVFGAAYHAAQLAGWDVAPLPG